MDEYEADKELHEGTELVKLLSEKDKLENKKRTPGEKARLGTVNHTIKIIMRNKARRNIEFLESRGKPPSGLDIEQSEYHGYPTPEGGRRRRRKTTRKNRRR